MKSQFSVSMHLMWSHHWWRLNTYIYIYIYLSAKEKTRIFIRHMIAHTEHSIVKAAQVLVLVSQSCLTFCNPMDCSRQAPLFMGFSRQKCWSGLNSINMSINPSSPTDQLCVLWQFWFKFSTSKNDGAIIFKYDIQGLTKYLPNILILFPVDLNLLLYHLSIDYDLVSSSGIG